MVLYLMRWDILPDKVEAYETWSREVIPRILAVPGIIEFRGYRPVTGASQAVVTLEFPDLGAWTAWYMDEDVQTMFNALRLLATNVTTELWGPSPLVSQPIRPRG